MDWLEAVSIIHRGRHCFCFKIEQGSTELFCGIISKNTSLQSLPSLLPYSRQNAYQSALSNGYTSVNNNGIFSFAFNNQYHSHNRVDITVELQVDCDQRQIHLRSNATVANQMQNVNITACPFPWQFFVGLLNAGDRIRLLPNVHLPREKVVVWA